MKISDVEALKGVARRNRWALEELVVDQKMQEANQLMSGSTNTMYGYLKEKLGSGEAVLHAATDLILWQRGRAKTLDMTTLASDLRDRKTNQG